MAKTSFEDVDHDAADGAPANLDERGGTGRGEGVEPSEEDALAEINRYMDDLLDRTGQRSASRAVSLVADDEPKSACDRRSGDERRAQNDRRGPEKGQTGAAEEAASSKGESPNEPNEPRRTAHVDCSPSLPAMRQLAKHSAYDAIEVHDSKLVANRALGKLCVTIVAACTAVLLFWMEPSLSAGTLPTILLAVAIAGIWGAQTLCLYLKSRRMVRTEPPAEAV